MRSNSDGLAHLPLDLVHLGRGRGLLRDVHGATANNRAAACAGAEFCKSHLYRHSVTPRLADRPPNVRLDHLLLFTVQLNRSQASELTHFLAWSAAFVGPSRKGLRLMFHLGAVLHEDYRVLVLLVPLTGRGYRPAQQGLRRCCGNARDRGQRRE
jgi:hypothetical protein